MSKPSEQKNICTECIGDKDFSYWIRTNGKKRKCDFEKSHGKTHSAVTVEEFAEHVDEYFREHYSLGDEYVYAVEDSDNMQYATYGSPYREILSDDLSCDDAVLEAICDNLPDASYYEIKQGGEPFYNEFSNYELIEEAAARDQADMEDYFYEIDASLGNQDPLSTLHQNMFSMRALLKSEHVAHIRLQKMQLIMIFGFCITSLEAYLGHIFTKNVLSDESLKEKYIKTEERFNTFRKTAAQLYLQREKLSDLLKEVDNYIKKTLQETTFHNIQQTKKLYKNVFNLDLDLEQFDEQIKKRHDFVHRGGRPKDGGPDVTTTKEEIEKLIVSIEKFCDDLDEKINSGKRPPVIKLY